MFERPLKLTHSENSKVYFTSDSHFGHNHEFIYDKRGYLSRLAHNEGLFKIINSLVRPEDILIHLGDFCLNSSQEEFEEYLSKIKCQNILYIWGNHNSRIRKAYEDTVEKQFGSRKLEVYPITYRNVTFLGYYKEIIVNGQMIVLHHYPHQIFNQMQKFAYQLSGHSHNSNPSTQISSKEGKILDVGWDGHNKPLDFDEIQAIMASKQHKKRDSYH
jgi:calcineurin-like phosphoesterase family protein